jgi:hypothetical protein
MGSTPANPETSGRLPDSASVRFGDTARGWKSSENRRVGGHGSELRTVPVRAVAEMLGLLLVNYGHISRFQIQDSADLSTRKFDSGI